MKNLTGRIIYFGDIMGDLEEEAEFIQKKLKNLDVKCLAIEIQETPEFFDEQFDVMFFDWGGMSVGNSLMDHFCREIIKMSENKPSTAFVMVSRFTKEAMEDAIRYFEIDEHNTPTNIFLTIEDFVKNWLRD